MGTTEGTFGKVYGLIVWCYWEHLKEQIGNIEKSQNIQQHPSPHPPQKLKKLGAPRCMMNHLIGST